MTKEQMASLKPGDTLEYNDGRDTPGGKGTATVIENGKRGVIVQFSDRRKNTHISHNDPDWTRFLRRV